MLWAVLSILSGFSFATSDALAKLYLSKEKTMSIVWSRFGFAYSGFFYGIMILFHFIALSLVIVPYMIALKRTSSIFGVAYGWLVFNERKILERIVGTSIMAFGVILILLF